MSEMGMERISSESLMVRATIRASQKAEGTNYPGSVQSQSGRYPLLCGME